MTERYTLITEIRSTRGDAYGSVQKTVTCIYDRLRGLSIPVAECGHPHDAEMIVAALNASAAETTVKPSNPRTITPFSPLEH